MSGPSARYRGGQVSYAPGEVADAGLIDSFKMKARNWWNDVQKLRATQVPPELEAEKQKLLKRAETVKAAIVKVTSIHDSLKIPGLSGYDGDNVLGALPLVPVAIIAAATAAIALWAKDYGIFLKQVAYQRQLVQQGIDPEKAAQIAQDAHALEKAQGGPLQFLLNNWQWVAAGVVGLLVWKFVKDNR